MFLYLLYPLYLLYLCVATTRKPCFPHAPYIGGMSKKKEERAKQRMYDSQREAMWGLREIRELNGLTQEDVARKMGTHNIYISQLENGKLGLKFSTLRRYALACGAKISFVVSEA